LDDLKRRCRHHSRSGLTIEYAIVMMTLVIAFSALILFTASLGTERAVSYQTYVEDKAFLDEVASVFIAKKGGENCLSDYLYFASSEEGTSEGTSGERARKGFTITTKSNGTAITLRVNYGSTVRLHVELNGDQVTLYRYCE